MILWLGLISEPARHCDFRGALGADPAAWYLSTQRRPGSSWEAPEFLEKAAKGTLAHFESVFAGDASLTRLRQQAKATAAPALEREKISA